MKPYSVLVSFLLLASLISCGGGAPTPAPGEKPVDVMDIWWDYEANEARANETWKGRWLYLRMNVVDEIESGGKVQMRVDQYGFQSIQFDFKDDRAALDIDRWDTIVATCKLDGLYLDSWMHFSDCVIDDP